jgi:uncharacterized membrane protein YgcG
MTLGTGTATTGIVLMWMLDTLSVELQEIIHEPLEPVLWAWLAIKALFLRNREPRILPLDEWFRAFRQGNLSISDYYYKMKGMADELRSLGDELPDRHLVLQLLRGLSKKYDHMKALIKRTMPLPNFHTIWNDFELEELDLKTEADPASATTLYVASSTAGHQQQQLPLSRLPLLCLCHPTCPPMTLPVLLSYLLALTMSWGKGKGKDKGGDSSLGSGKTSSGANIGGGSGASTWPSL